MGRSASPFKRFVHKCDRKQSLQCLHWQVVQSAGDVSDSAFIHTAPFVPYFVSVALPWAVPQLQKPKKAKRLFLCSVCLISLCRMLCCRPTCRRLYCKEYKAELRHWTTSDGGSLLRPPFHHFTFLILPSFTFPFIHCHFLLSFSFPVSSCVQWVSLTTTWWQ